MDELEFEMRLIKEHTTKNGWFMLAPNGKISNLDEWQWLLIRTKKFKYWYGDWENNAEIKTMQNRISEWLSADNLCIAKEKSRNQIFKIFGNELKPIAYISPEYLKYLDENINDNRVYSGKGYFIDHAVNHHSNTSIQEYFKMQEIINNPDDVKLDDKREKATIIFIKKYDKYGTVIVNADINEQKKIVFHKTFFMQNKKPYPNISSVRLNLSLVDGNQISGISTISPTKSSVAAVSLPALNDDANIQKFIYNDLFFTKILDENFEPLKNDIEKFYST